MSFKIPVIPATTQKTIRFPNNIIENIENQLIGTECSFSSFVIAATRNALMEIEEQQKK